MNFEQALNEARQNKIIYHADDEGDYSVASVGSCCRKRLVRKVEGEKRTIVKTIPAEWLFDNSWQSKEKDLSKEDLREKVRQLKEEKEKLEKQVQDLERKARMPAWMKEPKKDVQEEPDFSKMNTRELLLWRNKK